MNQYVESEGGWVKISNAVFVPNHEDWILVDCQEGINIRRLILPSHEEWVMRDCKKGLDLRTLNDETLFTIEVGGQERCHAMSPDGQCVAVATGRTVKVWNLDTKSLVKTLQLRGGANMLALGPHGHHLVVRSQYSTEIWDVLKGHCLETFMGDSNVFQFSPDGKYLAIAYSWSQLYRIIAIPSCQILTTVDIDIFVTTVTFSPDSRYIAHPKNYSEVGLQDLYKGFTPVKSYDMTPFLLPSVIAFSPDGTSLAVAADNEVYVWEISSGKRITTIQANRIVIRLSYSSCDKYLITALLNGTSLLWRITPNK